MGEGFVLDLITNAAILLALSVIYEIGHILPAFLARYRRVVFGLLIGVAAVSVMSVPFRMASDTGIVFDTRSVLLFSAGIAFGPLPTIIGAVIAGAYRILIGGTGAGTGVAVIVTSAALGIALRGWILRSRGRRRWLKCYLAALADHAVMILCFFFIPISRAWPIIEQITAPVLLIYPLASLALCVMLLHQSERNEALIKLAEEEGYHKNLFHDNKAIMFLVDPEDGRIIDVNLAASKYYGWPADVMRTMRISQINTLSDEETHEKFVDAYRRQAFPLIFRHRLADGQVRDVEIYSSRIHFHGRDLFYTIVHDISDRVAATEHLKASEARFRVLVESAPDGIALVVDGLFTYLNPAMLRLYGAESESQLLGQRADNRFIPDERDAIVARIQSTLLTTGFMASTDERHVRLDGRPIPVSAAAVALDIDGRQGTLVFIRDVSRQKELEEERIALAAQLQQQQKLEAIGTLAGGVAHEINNPIAGIMNYAQLILDMAEPATPTAEYAGEIIHESERISVIVKNLLQFSRMERQSHSLAMVEDIVGQTVSLIRTVIRKDQIRLDIDLEEGLPAIKCRSQQIQQVLMNLLTNARDALNEKYPHEDPDKLIRLSGRAFSQKGRRWLRLTVEDHGLGIADSIGGRIFDPFFSTKPKDKGTGLGLAISFGIVRDHHGVLSFETSAGEFTRFHLDLPVDNGWGVLKEEST